MTVEENVLLHSSSKFFSKITSVIIILAGGLVFIGWVFNIGTITIGLLIAVLTVVGLAVLIGWNARSLDRAEAERKRAESEIRQLNENLQGYAKNLEAANKELEAFSYSVSHDLRAPLRAIDGFSKILLEDYHDRLDAAGKDCLERVRAATLRMAQLIDDMLELSRVTRTEMRREKVDLNKIAKDVVEDLRASDPQRDVAFVVREGLEADGDPRLLRVVLGNLLGNAWKFTSKLNHATIEFGAIQLDGRPAYFVRDNGAGFDMAYAGKLFGIFQRLHAMAEFPGTGIGLATVQRIVHRHGGRVWAEGEVGKGATFYFTL
jgi:light-regulated signal transduction histidine kinase (bacteriophytochrome)